MSEREKEENIQKYVDNTLDTIRVCILFVCCYALTDGHFGSEYE